MFTRWALQHGTARVICFEPSPSNAECLRMNLASEMANGRVAVVQKGVWDSDTCLAFSTTNVRNPGGHHVAENGTGNVQVPVTSIDAACRELGLERIDYIKFDIEGAELRALAGAQETIGRYRPQLCIATEHTQDLFANAQAVWAAVKKMDPTYRMRVTEAHPYHSPSRGYVLTPYTMFFYHP